MIGNSAAPVQSAASLLGVGGGNTANAGGRSDAASDGTRYADYAASANASANAGPGTASTQDTAAAAATTASNAGAAPPATGTALPTQALAALQQQGAAAVAAANQAAALAANAAKLAAATATSATAQAADAATTAKAPTDALSMLAAMSAQEPGDATAAAPALPTPVAKPLDADSDTPTIPADATLSQQMLALLAGSLAITAPAQPTQGTVTLPTVDTSATGAGTSTASALMASNAASQLQQSPGLAQTGALSALLDPKAATAAPADVLNLAMNVALDADGGNTFAVPTDKEDKTALFGLSGTGVTAPTLDRTLTSNAVTATPLTMPARPHDGFDDGLGTRIAWMAEQKLGHAQIRLNPENAGPIDVRIQLDGSQVNASFHSANADVRQALEASLPRLREMLGQQGMQLGNTDIGQRQAQQQSSQGQPTPRGFTGNDDGSSAVTGISAQAAPIIVRSRGLLDEYA